MENNINKYENLGFTLLELMVTIAIAGILTVVAVPNFSQTIRNSRLTTNINRLVASLNYARSEAIKRNHAVSIRKNDTYWESGWIIFADINGNGVQNAGDTLLREYEPMPNNFTLRATGINRVTYRASGISGNSSFVLCDNGDGNNIPEPNTSKLMIINTIGRVRMGTDSNKNGIQEKFDGTEIISCITSPFT
ncbi:MAG: GspH/FimT family pseudopilin [Methylococcaceae bacterium]|nr:GspH/FimT family pseudopilin [Methylococcaceae bacterium]